MNDGGNFITMGKSASHAGYYKWKLATSSGRTDAGLQLRMGNPHVHLANIS